MVNLGHDLVRSPKLPLHTSRAKARLPSNSCCFPRRAAGKTVSWSLAQGGCGAGEFSRRPCWLAFLTDTPAQGWAFDPHSGVLVNESYRADCEEPAQS